MLAAVMPPAWARGSPRPHVHGVKDPGRSLDRGRGVAPVHVPHVGVGVHQPGHDDLPRDVADHGVVGDPDLSGRPHRHDPSTLDDDGAVGDGGRCDGDDLCTPEGDRSLLRAQVWGGEEGQGEEGQGFSHGSFDAVPGGTGRGGRHGMPRASARQVAARVPGVCRQARLALSCRDQRYPTSHPERSLSHETGPPGPSPCSRPDARFVRGRQRCEPPPGWLDIRHHDRHHRR
jgi:hypothetical protein